MVFLKSLPPSANYLVRIQCLFSTSTLLLKPINSNLIMSTAAKNMSTNSFGFPSPKSSSTCNICKRLLYSFEEILVCRVCHGSYHWRCVKPETISHYGENTHFICDKCNDNITTTTTSPTHRLSNGGIRIKSPDLSETDYRNFVNIPSKLNSIPTKDTTVVNAVRYFEEKQQQQIPKTSKLNEHTNGQYTDDSKAIRRTQQQIASEGDDNNTTGMFQANYQYTPLKEYAAMKTSRPTNEMNTNGYQNSSSSSPKTERQVYSRFNGDIHYTNKSPSHFTSPTIDNISVHNRQQNFISSTNLNVNDVSSRRQQQQPPPPSTSNLNHSTPYLSQVRDDDSPTFKTPYHQQQLDRHSNVGSDSGIVMNSFTPQHPINEENQIIEKKLTDLVQQLGRQLETDAQKLSEKLELKLKNLEHMIHQQTYIIRRQDEVIERLKNKILKIETERDHFRERLSVHEQREQDEKKYLNTTETDETTNQKLFEHDDQQQTSNDISTTRKFSTTSSGTTDHSRRSSKKTPAPRIDHPGSVVNNENESTVSKFINANPTNQERRASGSSTPTATAKLISTVPLVDKPAAASRLDDIIHQSNINNEAVSASPYYNKSDPRRHDVELKPNRSASSSSSSSSASLSTDANKLNQNNTGLPPRNSNFHRSLEAIPRKSSQTERTLNPTNKTTSLEFGRRPVEYDDPGSIYITPQEATHPASQYQNTVKGWLRKQNRDSFFKRIERYYCVLSNNALLLHKHENDTKPQKGINLRGAKVVQYEDPKYGPSLELTWSRRTNEPKRYHLYAGTPEEAQQWQTGIQTAIQNLDEKNKWQQYRMQT